MIGTAALLASMHTLIREVTQTLHPFLVAFFRNLIPLLLVLPMILRRGRDGWHTGQPVLQFVRCGIGICAMLSWFYGLSVFPIAIATALSFTSVIFVSIGAIIFLGEKASMVRSIGVVAGFVGVLVILRPGLGGIGLGGLWILGSSVLFAGGILLTKILSRTDSNLTIVFWAALLMTPLSFIPALFVWEWPNAREYLLLAGIGLLAATAHLCFTQALRMTDASATMPFDFTRLIWTTIFGYVFFAELPDHWTWVGAAIIVIGALTLMLHAASSDDQGEAQDDAVNRAGDLRKP